MLGKRVTNIFFNLESSRKKNSSIRKVCKANEEHTNDPREIMGEIHPYCTLYDKPLSEEDSSSLNSFLAGINTKTLTEEQRDALDEKIKVKEYYEALKSFQKDKSPGNDGITVEFYLGFWHLNSKTLVEALGYPHQHGALSSSQKQALITLLEKKEKDRRFLKNWRAILFVNVDVKIASKAIRRR